ncbi:unnamed protein product [Dicrocoelium dendriticum]|nr:unnamed protein product [Dicrocoelium dendriticum]
MLCQTFFREEYQLNYLIGTLSKPFIALIDGVTMGGGVGLSVHGKYRVATEKTLFSMPETAIGLFPDVGGGYFLPRLPFPGLGAFLALTGHRLNGLEVLWAGVATHYRPSNEIETLKEALYRLEFPAITCASDISKINKEIAHLLDARTEKPVAPVSLAPHMDAIGTIFALFESGAAVTVEDILRKLEIYSKTGTANKEWAETYINILNRMSPTSLKITLRQLQEGSKLSFADNFKMEFRLSQHCVRRPDLAEGIRAVLIDKDSSPRWDPPHLSLVTKELVDSYFSPIPGVPEWCI